MIRSGGWSDWFSESGRLGTRGSLFLVTLLVLFSMPLRAGSSNDFAPLFGGPSLEHYLGDIDSWSYQDGHLVAKTDSPRTESVFLRRTPTKENR